MHSIRRIVLAAGSLLAGTSVSAQRATPSAELRLFSEQRIRHQKTLGLTLGSYALANVAIGAIGASRATGETAHFYRMTAYWNLVNLGIAGIGLLGSRRTNADTETLSQAVRQHENMKQLLLVNAGLDVAYVAGGAYLVERANSHPDRADQLRGYGKSIMVQGGFLLAFDLVNFLIFRNRGDRQEKQLLQAASSGLGLVVPLK